MLGLAAKDAWLIGLLLICSGGFLAAARWSSRLAGERGLAFYSVGFSLAFAALVLATGLAVLR
jgi:hypothetical protein